MGDDRCHFGLVALEIPLLWLRCYSVRFVCSMHTRPSPPPRAPRQQRFAVSCGIKLLGIEGLTSPVEK